MKVFLMPFSRFALITAALLTLITRGAVAAPNKVTAGELLAHKQALHGNIVLVEGLVRFDRPSQRGFLYQTPKDLRNRNFRKTIFLELGNENYSSMKISDGSYVLVRGYLSKDLRGPLGVYPAHIIVDRMWRQSGQPQR